RQGPRHDLLRARQRRGLRHGLCRQALRRLPAAACRFGVPGHRHRPRHRAARRAPARRTRLGGREAGAGGGVLFHGTGGGGGRGGNGSGGAGMTDLAAVRVLFVEDSEDDVDLAVRALKREGLTPVWRVASAEAEMRALLREAPPQAILSDFSMPGFDGVQALRIAQELAPSVPFIFLSGTIGEERAIEAIRMGATDYVLKNNLRRLGYVLKRALAEAEDRERVRKAEEERARLVEILEATSDYVGMSDPEGRQIYINTAGSRLIGRSPEAILGQPIFDIYPAWARDIILHEARPRAEREGIWEGETAMLDGE